MNFLRPSVLFCTVGCATGNRYEHLHVGGGDLTGALHILRVPLSLLPPSSSLAAATSRTVWHSGISSHRLSWKLANKMSVVWLYIFVSNISTAQLLRTLYIWQFRNGMTTCLVIMVHWPLDLKWDCESLAQNSNCHNFLLFEIQVNREQTDGQTEWLPKGNSKWHGCITKKIHYVILDPKKWHKNIIQSDKSTSTQWKTIISNDLRIYVIEIQNKSLLRLHSADVQKCLNE